MNRRLALKVVIIDKETSGLVIIKNKSLVPLRALGFIFNNHQAIGLYLLHKVYELMATNRVTVFSFIVRQSPEFVTNIL